MKQDLDSAIEQHQKDVDHMSSDDPSLPRRLVDLGALYGGRYKKNRVLADLDSAIALFEKAIRLTTDDGPDRARQFLNMGFGYQDRYHRDAILKHLEIAITYLQTAMQLMPAGDPDELRLAQALGSCLGNRYRSDGASADLEAAIKLLERAVRLAPVDDPYRGGYLLNLGIAYQDRYHGTRAPTDLQAAIQHFEGALCYASSVESSYRLRTGLAYRDKYDATKDRADLDIAMRHIRQVLDDKPKDHPYWVEYLQLFTERRPNYREKEEKEVSVSDVDRYLQDILGRTLEHDPNRDSLAQGLKNLVDRQDKEIEQKSKKLLAISNAGSTLARSRDHTDSGYVTRSCAKSEGINKSSGLLEGICEDFQSSIEDDNDNITGAEYDIEVAVLRDNHIQANDDGVNAASTTYSESETSSLPRPRDRGYIDDIAAEIFNRIQSSDRLTLERIENILPDLLKAFALKIGYETQSTIARDISYFVHKHHRRIQHSFEDMFPLEDTQPSHPETEQRGEFSLSRYLEEPSFEYEPVRRFFEPTDDYDENIEPNLAALAQEDLQEAHAETSVDTEEIDAEIIANTNMYRDYLLTTSAFSWLVGILRRETTMTRASPDIMQDIKEKVLSAFPKPRLSRKAPLQAYETIFELDWDPLLFVQEQQYTETPGEALELAITLTGTGSDAQAVTTREYLSQTWPTTGAHIMRLVTDVIRNERDHSAISILPDKTQVQTQIKGTKFIVIAIGTRYSVAEIGQQFAWLAAACRSSPFESGIATCTPYIRFSPMDRTTSPAQIVQSDLVTARISAHIGFEVKEPVMDSSRLPGRCWHKMFRNPIMVSGYPVLSRNEAGLGVEMPLNMIGGLVGSERATEFDSKIFIKGFSTMLIAIRVAENLLVWHYLYNDKGERISYLDHGLQDIGDISLFQLDTARHVIGWCSKCEYFAGAADADYDIGGTGLPRPGSGCLLEKVSISGGKIITAGATFAIGVKDMPVHFNREGYIEQLRWITTKYVLLWDEADKRGWLVNGISALLHLVRASLKHSSEDDFSSVFRFKSEQLKNAADHKPNSAILVLIDEYNRALETYPGRMERLDEAEIRQVGDKTAISETLKKRKKHYQLFEDLVGQHFSNLEQIMEHHRHAAGQNGMNLKLKKRNSLEGWDFRELATDYDPHPRVATLQKNGYGWVNFIRSIDAITLFGRGFGEIIRPIPFDGMCSSWRSLPKTRYYLAIAIFDLQKITEKFGNGREEHLEPVHGLVWHCPGEPLGRCRYQESAIQNMNMDNHVSHHDPVQVFCPRGRPRLLRLRRPPELEDGGAVVFGESNGFNYTWSNNGAEDLEAEPETRQTAVHRSSSSGSLSRGAITLSTVSSQQSRELTPCSTVQSPSSTSKTESSSPGSNSGIDGLTSETPETAQKGLDSSESTGQVKNRRRRFWFLRRRHERR